jgi:hypothetical protein
MPDRYLISIKALSILQGIQEFIKTIRLQAVHFVVSDFMKKRI